MGEKKCPCGNGYMEIVKHEKDAEFKGINLKVLCEKYLCRKCGIEAGTIEQAARVQSLLAEAYRSEKGLLSGFSISKMRKESGLTEGQLAVLMNTTEKMINDWECCIVQSPEEDRLLRKILTVSENS